MSDDAEQPQDDPQEPLDPSPQPPDLNIDPEVLAAAVAEGEQAEATGNRLDAARTGILTQQVRILQSTLATLATALDNHHTQGRNRSMSSMSSRDTAYYEGRAELALSMLELLTNMGVTWQEGP